jgi:hypothetical protein
MTHSIGFGDLGLPIFAVGCVVPQGNASPRRIAASGFGWNLVRDRGWV